MIWLEVGTLEEAGIFISSLIINNIIHSCAVAAALLWKNDDGWKESGADIYPTDAGSSSARLPRNIKSGLFCSVTTEKISTRGMQETPT
jgi:hypothetical protein